MNGKERWSTWQRDSDKPIQIFFIFCDFATLCSQPRHPPYHTGAPWQQIAPSPLYSSSYSVGCTTGNAVTVAHSTKKQQSGRTIYYCYVVGWWLSYWHILHTIILKCNNKKWSEKGALSGHVIQLSIKTLTSKFGKWINPNDFSRHNSCFRSVEKLFDFKRHNLAKFMFPFRQAGWELPMLSTYCFNMLLMT
jgi:hypothetical protein